MKRICFMGDSHTAAIKRAWWAMESDHPGISITFFSAHRSKYVGLEVHGNTLVPGDDKLRETLLRSCNCEPVIAPDYDRYLLCGLDYSMRLTINSLRRFRSEDQTSDNRAPISSGCYLTAMTGCLRDTILVQTARKVRAITQQPMTIIPAPRVSDASGVERFRRLRESGDAALVAGYFDRSSDILCQELDADILQQPAETLSNPVQTLALYSKDAPREFGDTPRPDGWQDYQHMNADYGALVLRDLFAMPGF